MKRIAAPNSPGSLEAPEFHYHTSRK